MIDDFINSGLLSKRTKQLPFELKFKKIINYLIDYETKPEKMILPKKHKKLIWKILLHQTKFEEWQFPKIWLLASGAANSMNMQHNQNYYFQLRDFNLQYPNLGFHQIELDLRRTFPNDPPDKVEKFIDPLRNVLCTFLKRNPTIGYCQGMNFIAGNFLKHMNEQQSFWLFVSINENLLPIDYYSDMLGILVDQKVFEELMIEKFPKVVAHMQNNNY